MPRLWTRSYACPRRPARRSPRLPRAARLLAAAPLAVLAAAAACRTSPADVADGDDPLAALTVSAESKRYDEMYWRAHRDSKWS